MAAKKEETTPKPGYDETGFTPRNADVLMTYEIAGADDPQAVANYLWRTMPKGAEDQRDNVGPRIEKGTVIYQIFTIYRGAAQEEFNLDELRIKINAAVKDTVRVKMSHTTIPPLPTPIPGIDAPAVLSMEGK